MDFPSPAEAGLFVIADKSSANLSAGPARANTLHVIQLGKERRRHHDGSTSIPAPPGPGDRTMLRVHAGVDGLQKPSG